MSRDLQELLQEAGSGGAAALLPVGGSGGRAAKRRDPAAFRQRLAQRFAAKTSVYDNCLMYSQEGELLCHTGKQLLTEWGNVARGAGLGSTTAALPSDCVLKLRGCPIAQAVNRLSRPLSLAPQTVRSFSGI
jgi:hypothetical protein